MKVILIELILFFATQVLMSQTIHFNEDFDHINFPPSGWIITSNLENWGKLYYSYAGGNMPEVMFKWSPAFEGDSRLISPQINLDGMTGLKIEFKYMLDHYFGDYTIGVATRSDGGGWHIVWELSNPGASVSATKAVVTITNEDVGASNFQICWFFVGNSSHLNYWYIDDCKLYTPFEHDIMVKDIPIETRYNPEEQIVPEAVLFNDGLNEETFDANCVIYVQGVLVYNQTVTSITLQPDEEQTVTFPPYTASVANELYDLKITSILLGDMDPSDDSAEKLLNTYTTPRDMVILEIGTGTWCGSCPGAQMGAHLLIGNGLDVGVIEYHYNDLFTNSYSSGRVSYYNIYAFPTSIFGGIEKLVLGSYNVPLYHDYLPFYESRHSINTAFSIDIFGQNTGRDYSINVELTKLATIPNEWDDMVLHLVLTESDITFNWQGQTELHYVERLMIPNELGTEVDLTNISNLSIDLNFSLDSAWVKPKCELVAFLQSIDTKEILQGSKIKLTELYPMPVEQIFVETPSEFTLSQNYPNPFNPSTTISYAIPENSPVSIKVYDLTGQEIAVLVDDIKNAGTYDVKFDASGLSSGIYFYRLQAGSFNSIKKLAILK